MEKGLTALYKELGVVQTIKFLQSIGINRGDSLKEIESITEKMTKEQVIEMIKRTKSTE